MPMAAGHWARCLPVADIVAACAAVSVLAAFVLLLLLALAFVVAERTVLRPADAPLDRSLAVLPFESLSDDKANAYFAQGIQDEILTRLSRVGALRVISTLPLAARGAKPPAIAMAVSAVMLAT